MLGSQMESQNTGLSGGDRGTGSRVSKTNLTQDGCESAGNASGRTAMEVPGCTGDVGARARTPHVSTQIVPGIAAGTAVSQ